MHCATIASNAGGVFTSSTTAKNGSLFEPQDVPRAHGSHAHAGDRCRKAPRHGEALMKRRSATSPCRPWSKKQKHYYEIIIRRFHRPRLERDGVVICGAYGKGNGGDNAILDAIVAQLRHIDPDLPICALSRTPKETRAGRLASICSIRSGCSPSAAGCATRSSTSAAAAPSFRTPRARARSSITFRASAWPPARAAASCSMAAASAPSRARATANAPPKRLNRYAGRSSPCATGLPEEMLRALGVTTPPEIRLTADPALIPGDTPAIRSFLHHSGSQTASSRAMLLFALRPWKDFDRHIAAFANAAEYAHREYGLTPVLYAMEPCRDRAALNAVAAQLRCPYLLLEAGSNGTEIVALIRRMSLVIAMRLQYAGSLPPGRRVPMGRRRPRPEGQRLPRLPRAGPLPPAGGGKRRLAVRPHRHGHGRADVRGRKYPQPAGAGRRERRAGPSSADGEQAAGDPAEALRQQLSPGLRFCGRELFPRPYFSAGD